MTSLQENGEVFGTRASEHQYEIVKQVLPQVVYDPISHILKIEKEDKKHIGKIAICSAGTADIPVAEEAAQTAEFFGANVDRIYDVGVSGVHRLLAQLDTVQEANCVVAVAGMEGALAPQIEEQPVALAIIMRSPTSCVTSLAYGVSPQPAQAPENSSKGCSN